MKMKNLFADIGDRVVLQLPDTHDVREGRVTDWRDTHASEGYDLYVEWDDGSASFVRGFLLQRMDDPQPVKAAA